MKILITDKMAEEAVKRLEAAGHDVTFDEMDHDALLDAIDAYDGLMIRSRTKVTEYIVRKGAKGKLKVIGRVGIGVDNIDIKTAGSLGIKVVNAPTGATISVAELAIAHMLSLSRHLTKADRTMKQGEWIKKQLKGSELYGKTLGLVGCGNIGQKTAQLAQAFGMTVIGFDPFLSKESLEKQNITKLETLEGVIKSSDIISLHLPHTERTHYIIDSSMLSQMKSSALLINCARGGTVDEAALYDALKKGKIAGAALDVFEKEPPGETKLANLENIVLTPHIGASTTEGQIRAGTVCAEQVIKVLNDETPDHWVNKAMIA
ncbi:MAG: hydroxyacid dehydrogenase [Candidatus Thermoplasmatota archaeon]|nr:hydroxyacid dehydrogenase [Candidatus Thermoplasmatota archaeon]